MKDDSLLEEFLVSLKKRLPDKINLATVLCDILNMGKEAVYRRLRGDVPFSFQEAATIARATGISLDQAINLSQPDSAGFKIQCLRYMNPSSSDLTHFKKWVDIVKLIGKDPESEMGCSSNMLPQPFLVKHRKLSKLLSYKWMYQNDHSESIPAFHEIDIPQEMYDCHQGYAQESLQIKKTIYIWDNKIFYDPVNIIKYYSRIQLMNKSDAMELKEELLCLVDELEEIAIKGRNSIGNAVYFYISNIDFETTYSYFQSQNYHCSMIRVFTMNNIVSEDDKIFLQFKEWIQALKKVSILISESGEMQRVRFFNKQRDYINTLSW